MLKKLIAFGIALLIVLLPNYDAILHFFAPPPIYLNLCEFKETGYGIKFAKEFERGHGVSDYLGVIKIDLSKYTVTTNSEVTFKIPANGFRIEQNERKSFVNPYYYIFIFDPDGLRYTFPCFSGQDGSYMNNLFGDVRSFSCKPSDNYCSLPTLKLISWDNSPLYRSCETKNLELFSFSNICVNRSDLIGTYSGQNYAYKLYPDRGGEWVIYALLFDSGIEGQTSMGGDKPIEVSIASFTVLDQSPETFNTFAALFGIITIVIAIVQYYWMIYRGGYDKIRRNKRVSIFIAIFLLCLIVAILSVCIFCPHYCINCS